MSRLEWSRKDDGATSSAEVGDVSLRVERDLDSDPAFCWEVRGYCSTRQGAFDAAERAALASVRMDRLGLNAIQALTAKETTGRVELLVDGRPDGALLTQLLRLAFEASLAPAPEIPKALKANRNRLSDVRRKTSNVVRIGGR